METDDPPYETESSCSSDSLSIDSGSKNKDMTEKQEEKKRLCQ